MDTALFQICSALFAALAAMVWAWSSLVNLPVIGPSYSTIENLKPFYLAMKKIALLNASAAAFAFLSALSQAMAFYLMLISKLYTGVRTSFRFAQFGFGGSEHGTCRVDETSVRST
jgi:hypothetical protein